MPASIFLRVGPIHLLPDEYIVKLNKGDDATEDADTITENGFLESGMKKAQLRQFKRFLVDLDYRTGKTAGKIHLVVDIRARLALVRTKGGGLHPHNAAQAIERAIELYIEDGEQGTLLAPTATPKPDLFVCRTDPMRLVALLHFLQDLGEIETPRYLADEVPTF